MQTSHTIVAPLYWHSHVHGDRCGSTHQKALQVVLAVYGQDHLDVSTSYNNIGAVYQKQGKYEEALVQYQTDLEITTRVVGYNHPDVAASYMGIGLDGA